MLPTPRLPSLPVSIYPPAEDSYLLIDVLSSPSETTFLRARLAANRQSSSQSLSLPPADPPDNCSDPVSQTFSHDASVGAPLVVDVGTGSGIALAFLTRHTAAILGRTDVLTLGVDVSLVACRVAGQTLALAVADASTLPPAESTAFNPNSEASCAGSESTNFEAGQHHTPRSTSSCLSRPAALPLDVLQSDLLSSLRPRSVDVLVCNPPYVPTEDLPAIAADSEHARARTSTTAHMPLTGSASSTTTDFENSDKAGSLSYEAESRLVSLTYSGGAPDGMQVTDRLLFELPRVLSDRGVAYILLCARNGVQNVVRTVQIWGPDGARAPVVQGTGVSSQVHHSQTDTHSDARDYRARTQTEPSIHDEAQEQRLAAFWEAQVVGESGGKGGWERLSIVRICRTGITARQKA